MRNKTYFVAASTETARVAEICTAARLEWHGHTIPPDHARTLYVVMRPGEAIEQEIAAKYLCFPELQDQSERITQALIDAFPPSAGLTLADNTYSAMKKVHTTLGMAAMHPKA